MDRGAWWATVHSVTKSHTQLKQLSTQHTEPGLDKHLILEETHHQLNSKGHLGCFQVVLSFVLLVYIPFARMLCK